MPELPDPVTWTPGEEPPPDLQELPPGFHWEMSVQASAEVVHADGSKG